MARLGYVPPPVGLTSRQEKRRSIVASLRDSAEWALADARHADERRDGVGAAEYRRWADEYKRAAKAVERSDDP